MGHSAEIKVRSFSRINYEILSPFSAPGNY